MTVWSMTSSWSRCYPTHMFLIINADTGHEHWNMIPTYMKNLEKRKCIYRLKHVYLWQSIRVHEHSLKPKFQLKEILLRSSIQIVKVKKVRRITRFGDWLKGKQRAHRRASPSKLSSKLCFDFKSQQITA